jgi:hypothetical protein
LTSLDISETDLYAEGTKLLAAALKSNQIMTALNISSNAMTFDGEDFSDMSGVAALADAIPGMGALLVLSLQNNEFFDAGGKALAEGLKDNQVITELNIASNRLGCKTGFYSDGADMSGIIALADVIPDMRAMSKFTFSGDESWSKPVTMETTMTEADFSSKDLGISGGMLVAAFLPKCQ